METIDETFGVIGESCAVYSIFRCELSDVAFFDVYGINLSCSGCRSGLEIKCSRFFVHGVESRYVHVIGRKNFLLNTLLRQEICPSPSIFLAQDDESSVAQPLPFVKEQIIDKKLFAFFFVEKLRDGRFGIAREHFHFSLVAIEP